MKGISKLPQPDKTMDEKNITQKSKTKNKATEKLLTPHDATFKQAMAQYQGKLFKNYQSIKRRLCL
jgi:hypothetical protein